MNLVALEEAIGTRIVASLTGQSAAYQDVASEVVSDGTEVKQGADPVVVFTLLVGEGEDDFDENSARVVYRVNIWDHRKNRTANAKAVYEAVYGNGTPSTTPTFGLHRWKPTGSGFTATEMRRTNFGHPHDGDTLHYFIDFETYTRDA